MTQQDVFGGAQWVCAGPYTSNDSLNPDPLGTPYFPIIRSHFTSGHVKKATLRVLGLGFFYCYINGKPVSEDTFLPLSTNYEPQRNYPIDEIQQGCRIYVPEYDVTDLIEPGGNVLALHFGGGWYTTDGGFWCPDHVPYGTAKAIFRLTLETDDGISEVLSSVNDRIGDSFVKTYNFFYLEHHDYTDFDFQCFTKDFDDSAWPHPQPAAPLNTEYLFTDCPADRVEEVRDVICIHENGSEKSYDSGRNCSAVPVLKLTGTAGDPVTVCFSEERNNDGTPDVNFSYRQKFSFICDGTDRLVQPLFTWFGFRYFTVTGNAVPVGVKVIHSDVKVTSDFHCDNETLNWIYRAYLNTQLSNMHAGIPSDCPHVERKGYTGDGQLTCRAAMTTLDAKAFYKKWIDDISDCQDVKTGHIQYTAPYYHCGGGPGGWGCAIIEVPYQYYKFYGDSEPLARLYPQMLRYFEYLEAHSENELVVSDKEGDWCLGDWCAPIQVILPSPFVNNYFYIKSLSRMIEIAPLVGHSEDADIFKRKMETRKKATISAYFNTHDSNFIGGLQGGNAFALDIGLGNQQTYENTLDYYRKLGRYDTGIFGTDVLTRVLFENGDGELAVALLTSRDNISYEGMRRAGATTIWENWPDAVWDRSRNHPMFGAVCAYLFEYLLGIQSKDNLPACKAITISPVLVPQLNHVDGYRTIPTGKVHVSYTKHADSVDFSIVIPENQQAEFRYQDEIIPLHTGENRITRMIQH